MPETQEPWASPGARGSGEAGEAGDGGKGFAVSAPSVSLPKGGGAIRGIGEKFAANPVTGTGSTSVPIATSPGRSGFGPELSLSYDSGTGNGPFGFGWSLSLPSISRKTDRGLPRYRDTEESDVFLLSGAEDLVPVLEEDEENGARHRHEARRTVDGVEYLVRRYRPRVEGLFARIERWTAVETGEIHWRSISRDNVSTLYGKDDGSRIRDPEDPTRIFRWLVCESRDDRGNAAVYEYRPDDGTGVDLTRAHERNRTESVRSVNRYPKRIRYGNRISALVEPELSETDWMFEVVFDYGEHDAEAPAPEDDGPWLCRHDPFSSYRAGFEVRTYRLCQRVLMFHHFPDEEDVGRDGLVRSTDFTYRSDRGEPEDRRKGGPVASFIAAVTQSGYRRREGGYLKRSLPPLEFTYSRVEIQEEIRELDDESMENLPQGLDRALYRWVDLDGEGVSGILTEQADAWFYKPNLGGGRFGPLRPVKARPSSAALAGGHQQLLDLAGDGRLDLVELTGPTPGFYERDDEDWKAFRPFSRFPNLSWDDPNLRFADLTGDGHADVLITEDEVVTWHPSLAEEGFGPAREVASATDEESGPRLLFADGTQSVHLADMSGDDLSDLVRVRNGEVCYWPNLGYGRFGAKVAMDDAPWLDAPDQFDQRRVRLADIDGSGNVDVVYLGRDGVRLYFNQSGNRWSGARPLERFPPVDDVSSVAALDLLGNGTACLVWSSPLPGDARGPLRYVDLMGGRKPHLLTEVRNNLGAETHVRYVPSTKFYLADKAAGRPWVTRLPFPVHVVERVETHDRISRNRFVTRYTYHHGHFDGAEREFRGFGMVEQWDTEEIAALTAEGDFPDAANLDEASHVPPVLTRTWFHTGVHVGRGHVSDFYAGLLDGDDRGEYYREPGLDDEEARALLLPDTVLPEGLSDEEEREACRALKGSMLRQEVYALDGTDKEEHPYAVTEQNFAVRRLQPRGENRHGVFLTHPREALTYHYERNPADPRVAHDLTLEVDAFGNVVKEASVGYGRRAPDPELDPGDQARQSRTLVTYTENRFTNAVDEADAHRAPLPAETRTYELTGYAPMGEGGRFRAADFVQADGDGLTHRFDGEVAYEAEPGGGRQRRLVEHVRTAYRPDDLGAAEGDPDALLPLGTVEPLALPGESYKLAFTPGLLADVFRRPLDLVREPGAPPPEDLLPSPGEVLPADAEGGEVVDRGGYVSSETLRGRGAFPGDDGHPLWTRSDADGHWWVPSGRAFHSPEPGDDAVAERAHAGAHFFLPVRYVDPFGQTTKITYDGYDLLVLETRDPLDNRVTAGERAPDPTQPLVEGGLDYRVLQPVLVMDPNRNRSAVAFDALGMVVGRAVMGKPDGDVGDSLEGFETDLPEAVVRDHLDSPLADSDAILGRATVRLVYDLGAYRRSRDEPDPRPVTVCTLVREVHDADLPPGQATGIQCSFSYSDGLGREIQKKMQAEPGPVAQRDAEGRIALDSEGQPELTEGDADPRWVGSGWTVFNNKGKPVRQYEPFFTDTHRFEFAVRLGVSAVVFYDPIGRVVATAHPDHTWEKVVFDSWRRETWDTADTVLVPDPRDDADVGDFLRRLPETDVLPTWYARRASGTLGPLQETAASKSEVYAETPTEMHRDSLGRLFLTVDHNVVKYSHTDTATSAEEEFHATRVRLDIEGNDRGVIDALGRAVVRYDYDMLGSRIHEASMEAGERWTLANVTGKPIRAWDSRGHGFRTAYDARGRPTDSFLRTGDGADRLIERIIYGESRPHPGPGNLRGQVVQVFDQAGVVTTDEYDFKGNRLASRRRFAREYRAVLDWSDDVALEEESFTSRTRYDALDRPVQIVLPHANRPGTTIGVVQPTYNEANLLESTDVWLDQDSEPAGLFDEGTADLRALEDVDYDAKGQRTRISYGNGVERTCEYDPSTYRLTRLVTRRNSAAFPDDCPEPRLSDWPGCELQSLRYVYDAASNIAHIRDEAQQAIFFRNRRVDPGRDYTYDAVYRLVEATGREHLGQASGRPNAPTAYGAFDGFHARLDHPGDGDAMGRYLQRYAYDAVGNILSMQHRGMDPANPGWTRSYAYEEPSQLEEGVMNNRLSATSLGGTTATCRYEGEAGLHGDVTAMAHLPVMRWDHRDQLRATARQVVSGGGTAEMTWYVYDSGGRRVRKVVDRPSATGGAPRRMYERIYLAGFEIHRKYEGDGDSIALERETLKVTHDGRPVVLVETRTRGADPSPARLPRYILSDHLGSGSLELDDQARIVSYEELTPYGSTSYQAVSSVTETPKRYRYTGKERDEETGLYYHGARYYAPWLGRWLSADQAGLSDGENVFAYVRGNPVKFVDPTGFQSSDPRDPANYGTVEEYRDALSQLDGRSYTYEEAERLAVEGFGSPPSGTTGSGPDAPSRTAGRVIEPPPPVSAPDTTLYVPQGFVYSQYQAAQREADNPDNPWYVRAGMFTLGLASGPLALAEEYVARPVTNIPYVVHNAGIGIGEHAGRAYLWAQQGESGEAVVEALRATVDASMGFVVAASAAAPVAGAVESRAASVTATESTVQRRTLNQVDEVAGSEFLDVGVRSEGAGLSQAMRNRLHHIFTNPRHQHNLQGVVGEFGSQLNAFNAMQRAINSRVARQGITGVFEEVVTVGSHQVTIRGRVIDGVARISTAFIP